MFLVILLSSCVLVNADVLCVEERHLATCLRNISVRYFHPKRTLVISLSRYTDGRSDNLSFVNMNSDEFSMESVLAEEIHNLQMWPIITSNVWGRPISNVISMRKPVYDKYESYIIISYGTEAVDVLERIMEQIQTLSSLPSWNPRARFIVTPITKPDASSSKGGAQKLLSSLWQWKIINVVVLIGMSQCFGKKFVPKRQSVRIFELYTWFPYETPNQCSTVRNVVLLDKWTTEGQGNFIMNANLFPVKIKNNLHRCPITATTFPLEIAIDMGTEVNTETNTEVTYSEGWEVKLLKIIAEGLNSSIRYILPPPNDEKWGDLLDNGSSTGLTGDLVNSRADIGFAAWPLQPRTLKAVDATRSYFRDEWVWWVPCAKKLPRWKSIFMVFSAGTWAACLLSLVFSLLFMVLLAKCEDRTGIVLEWQVYRSLPSCFSCVWAVLLDVSVSAMPRTSSLRAFFVSWVCYCHAITTVFGTFLVAYLINPGLQHQINSFEEIITSGKEFGYHVTIGSIVRESDNTIMKQRICCDNHNIPPCLDWVAYHNNFTLLSSTTFMHYTLTRWYLDEKGRPLICQAGDTFYGANYVTYMTKGSPLLKLFNRMISHRIEDGTLGHILKKGMDLQRIQAAARAREVFIGEYYSLSLQHLQGAFLMYIGGLALSCAAFAGEHLQRQFSVIKDRHIHNECTATVR